MKTFQDEMQEYKRQMKLGVMPNAFRGLMDFMWGLKTHLKNKHPEYNLSGSMYLGYMDMTYFSFFPDSLKKHKLKTGIVFIHESCQFEAWLFGVNKQIQKKYWKIIKDSGWDIYSLVETTEGEDAILRHVLTDNPDFDNLGTLTERIEIETLKFIRILEGFLEKI